jgi:hypothetical protein
MAATDPYYDDLEGEDAQNCREGYVRVMCNGRILQIREDIINQSQLMNFLATARPADNLSECIHIANELASVETMKVICDWIAKHIDFASRAASDEDRRSFDQSFFLLNAAGHAAYAAAATDAEKAEILDSRKDWLRWRVDDPANEDPKRAKFQGEKPVPAWQRKEPVLDRRHRTYEEIQHIMFVANFLELHPSDWHKAFALKENERIASQPPGPFQEYGLDPADKFAETAMELCCHHLGDMILGCESPVDMQHRFPTLIGRKVLTAKDRYDIVTADLWIHGDDFVTEVVGELQEEQKKEFQSARDMGMSDKEIEEKYGKPIPDWTIESTQEERAFMKEVPTTEPNPTLKVPAIKVNDSQPADEGFEISHHWWG